MVRSEQQLQQTTLTLSEEVLGGAAEQRATDAASSQQAVNVGA